MEAEIQEIFLSEGGGDTLERKVLSYKFLGSFLTAAKPKRCIGFYSDAFFEGGKSNAKKYGSI
jgi:hypothetical protein